MSSFLGWLNDKSVYNIDLFQPFKFVSLRKMIPFYSEVFLQVFTLLNEFDREFEKMKGRGKDDETVSSDHFAKARAGWEQNYKYLLMLKLNMSAKSAKRVFDYISQENKQISIRELSLRIDEFRKRLPDELEDRRSFMVSADRADFYDKKGTILGESVIKEFTALETNAIEAGNCFALGRYTACVFHLMRIMEYIIHQFADKVDVDVDLDRDTWGTILDHIWDQKISKWPKGAIKKKYAACHKSMGGMRARRDLLIHHDDNYTKERASNLIGTVKSCIEDYLKLPPP